jgi:hypothetical protein
MTLASVSLGFDYKMTPYMTGKRILPPSPPALSEYFREKGI